MHEQTAMPLLKLLVVIIDRGKAEKITELLRGDHIGLQYMTQAFGTASSETMDVLGLGQTDKGMVLCIGADYRIQELLGRITERFQLKYAGKGVAFTVPINGISSSVLRLAGEENAQPPKQKPEKEVETVPSEVTHDLIVAVINQGYSEDLMTAAKAAGATGGTVFHARRIASDEAIKFFGITIQAEKEIVAIVAKRESKHAIMQAISQGCGMATEAKGIVISLPVDGMVGIKE
jgi:hypothetical protein